MFQRVPASVQGCFHWGKDPGRFFRAFLFHQLLMPAWVNGFTFYPSLFESFKSCSVCSYCCVDLGVVTLAFRWVGLKLFSEFEIGQQDRKSTRLNSRH